MYPKKHIALVNLSRGESGTVIEIAGGGGVNRRLAAMGIRVGKKISKVSDAFMRGPVTVQLGGTQISMGFGIASKILVEPEQ